MKKTLYLLLFILMATGCNQQAIDIEIPSELVTSTKTDRVEVVSLVSESDRLTSEVATEGVSEADSEVDVELEVDIEVEVDVEEIVNEPTLDEATEVVSKRVELPVGRWQSDDDLFLYISAKDEDYELLYWKYDKIVANFLLVYEKELDLYVAKTKEGKVLLNSSFVDHKIILTTFEDSSMNWKGIEPSSSDFYLTDDVKKVVELLPYDLKLGHTFYDTEAFVVAFEQGEVIAMSVYNDEVEYDDLSDEELALVAVYESAEMNFPWETISNGCSWYCGGGPSEVHASSYLNDDDYYSANQAHDGNLMTAWVEGEEDDGIGNRITYKFDYRSPRITTVIIYNGYQKNEETYFDNNRVKAMKVTIDGIDYGLIQLQDTTEPQYFDIVPTTTWTDQIDLSFEILDVYKGDKYSDTCIAEINFDGLDVHCFAEGSNIRMSDGTDQLIDELQAGDLLMGYKPSTGEYKEVGVTNVYEAEHGQYVRYSMEETEITVTYSHPMVDYYGNIYSFDPLRTEEIYDFEDVKMISSGILLIDSEGNPIEITEINKINGPLNGYSVNIKEGFGYFINGLFNMVY